MMYQSHEVKKNIVFAQLKNMFCRNPYNEHLNTYHD